MGVSYAHHPAFLNRASCCISSAYESLSNAYFPPDLPGVNLNDDARQPVFIMRNARESETEHGIYVDTISGEPLFATIHKCGSGDKWLIFFRPLEEERIKEFTDRSYGMIRTEVRSRYANSPLGHVFPDDPSPTGLRYCIRFSAVQFVPQVELEASGYGEYKVVFDAAHENDY